MMAQLQQLKPLSLRVAIFSLCVALVVLAVLQLWKFYLYGLSVSATVLAPLFLATAYGLTRLSVWARRVSTVVLWFLVIVLPVGIINPFHASDMMAAGRTPPPVELLLAILAPVVVWALWCLHLLGKFKAKFT